MVHMVQFFAAKFKEKAINRASNQSVDSLIGKRHIITVAHDYANPIHWMLESYVAGTSFVSM